MTTDSVVWCNFAGIKETNMWKFYALLSALFAALTAILAKLGVGQINSNLATAIRTGVVLLLTWGIVIFGSHLQEVKDSWDILSLSIFLVHHEWDEYQKEG